MGYVDLGTLHTPIGGARPPANYGRQIEDNFDFLANPPRCRIRISSALSVPNTTNTTPTFDSERSDTDTMHSTSVDTERITFTTPGTYLIGSFAQWAASSTGSRYIEIFLNGVTQLAGQASKAYDEAGFGTGHTFETLWAVSAGDYATVRVRQNSGSALNLDVLEFWAIWQAA